MESVLTSMLALIIMIVSVLTTYQANDRAIGQAAASFREMTVQAEERISTRIQATEYSLDASGDGLSLTVVNTGQHTISAFNRMDLIAEYTDDTGVPVVQSLTYTPGAPAAGEWSAWSIIDDHFNPRLLDPGESLVITARLPRPVGAAEDGNAVVVAPTGASASIRFERQ